jgi:excisionase family DNA binding protein
VKDPARPERIKTAEAALIVGLSVRTVQAMAARGELPGAARIGSLWTFNEAKLQQFILDKEHETERRAANIRQALSRPTARGVRPPSERAVEKRYEETMAQLLENLLRKPGDARRRESVLLIRKKAKVNERRCQKQPERQMSRRRSTFSQADVTRASRGAAKAGLAVRRVEIDATGKIVIGCVEDAPEQPEGVRAFGERAGGIAEEGF